MSDDCKSCGAPIFWVTMRGTERPAPLDVEPSDKGNVVVDDARGRVLSRFELEEVPLDPRYMSHFVTCPQRKQWRTRRG